MSKSQQRVSQISIVSICELKVMVSLIGRSSNRMLKFFQFKSEAEKKTSKNYSKFLPLSNYHRQHCHLWPHSQECS